MRSPLLFHSVSLAAVMALLSYSLEAQTTESAPWQLQRNAATPLLSGTFGIYAAPVLDMDGDGSEDLAVAASTYPATAGSFVGRVYVYSGRSGLELFHVDGEQNSQGFGLALLSPGDVNADQVPDLAVGSYNYDISGGNDRGRVSMYSGANGALLWHCNGTLASGNFGFALAVAPDLDSDGAHELLVGDPGYTSTMTDQGRVAFVNGRTGTMMGEALGTVLFGQLGKFLATRSGVVGLFASNMNDAVYTIGLPALGTAPVSLLLPGGTPGQQLGARLALLFDPTGMRLVVGRPSEDFPGRPNAGSVRVYSTLGLLLFEHLGTQSQAAVGSLIASARDLDGDGSEEVLFSSATGAPDRHRVQCFALDQRILVDQVLPQLHALSSLPDLNGDGLGEWVGTRAATASSYFHASIIAAGLSVTSVVQNPSASFVDLRIEAGLAKASRPYLLLFSGSPTYPGSVAPGGLHVPLLIDPLTEVFLGLLGSPLLTGGSGMLDALGRANASIWLPEPLPTLLAGMDLAVVAVSADGAGVTIKHASNPVVLSY